MIEFDVIFCFYFFILEFRRLVNKYIYYLLFAYLLYFLFIYFSTFYIDGLNYDIMIMISGQYYSLLPHYSLYSIYLFSTAAEKSRINRFICIISVS